MEMPGHLRASLADDGLVSKDDPVDFTLLLDPAPTMVKETVVMVPDDPDPIQSICKAFEEFPRFRCKPVASEAVVKTVTKAEKTRDGGALHLSGQRGQRFQRIIWRKHLPQPREPTGLLQMQVGNQQRIRRWPVKRTFGTCEK